MSLERREKEIKNFNEEEISNLAYTWAPQLNPGLNDVLLEANIGKQPVYHFHWHSVQATEKNVHIISVGFPSQARVSIIGFEYHSSNTLQHPPIRTHDRFKGYHEWAFIHAIYTAEHARGQGFAMVNLTLFNKLIEQRSKIKQIPVIAFTVDDTTDGQTQLALRDHGFLEANKIPSRLLRIIGQGVPLYRAIIPDKTQS